jgi:hypothetical protein
MSTQFIVSSRSTEVQPRFRGWIAASPAIYLIHDLEELATVRAWVADNWQKLPDPVVQWLGANADLTHLYAVGIATVFVAMAAVSVAAARASASRAVITLFALTIMMRFGNGLLHIAQAVFARGYVPGLISAIVLLLPYSVWLVMRLRRDGLIRHEAVHVLFMAGLLLQIPLIATVLLFASLVTR